MVSNFTPVRREGYRVGVPQPGRWSERLNTDSAYYGGGNSGNLGAVHTEPRPMHATPSRCGSRCRRCPRCT